MKKLILSSAIFLASVAGAFAQIAAGNIAIGGTLGLTSTSGKTKTTTNGTTTDTDSPKTTTFSILPNVSYFISNKFAVGIGIGYGGNSTTNYATKTNGDKVSLKGSSSAFEINPFVKYYISTGEKSAFFFKGGVDLSFGKVKGQSLVNDATKDNDPTKNTTVGFGITPGFLFFPADNWGVELGLGGNLLGYKSSTDKTSGTGYDTKTTTNTLELLGVNTLGASVSVYYFIK